MEKDLQRQLDVIISGTEDILIKKDLKPMIQKSISENKPLKINLGLESTTPDIHLGNTVVLNKLRQFQELGHKAILIIGDYTVRIGDPSGRSTIRPRLSPDAIEKNARTYMDQAFRILIPEETEVVKNSKWLRNLRFEDILDLTSRFTVARMLERDDFKKRYKSNTPIAIMEFLYPIMQAYDSYAIEADIELGGTDQRFNLLMGRELQKEFGQRPQIAILMPILVGTDGVEKMSKSLGNYIGVAESPDEIFGKVMSIPDSIIIDYYRLLTRVGKFEIDKIDKNIKEKGENPVIAKRNLAKLIVQYLHDWRKAISAEKKFDSIFKEKKIPDEVEEYVPRQEDIKDGKIRLVNLLVSSGLAESNSKARQLITQGAIKLNDLKIEDPNLELELKDISGKVIQKGKRFFRKII